MVLEVRDTVLVAEAMILLLWLQTVWEVTLRVMAGELLR